MSSEDERGAPRRRTAVWAARALVVAGTLSALALVAGWCGAAWWMLDLAAHFRVLELAGLLAAVLGLALLARWRFAACFLAIGVLFSLRLVPYVLGGAAEPAGGRGLCVASLNVLSGNRHTEQIRAFVRECRADVLLLIEVDRATLDALEPELRGFTQRLELPRDDPFGIALFSRLPGRLQRTDDLGTCRIPAIVAELELDGAPLRLLAMHALPPITPSNAAERDRAIADAVETLCRDERPAILLGDLNTTPWAESLDRLVFARGFSDARRSSGILPTWPADSLLLRIPIDHCLVRGPWRVLGMHIGAPCGSDHLGIVAELELAR